MQDLAITAKRLGIILLAIYCPCCLWYLLRLKFRPPFAAFGGALWTDMEVMQKALVGVYLEEDGCLPKQFSPFCDIRSRIEYPRHWSKFGYLHKSGVWLYGAPDDIFDQTDDSLCIVDHKSAHNKGEEDPFVVQYEIQGIGYGNIAEVGLNLGRVSRAGIWYWDVDRESVLADPKKFVKNGRLCPPFEIKPIEVEMDYARLDPLLKELKKVWNSTTPPESREDCFDCRRRKTLNAIEESISSEDRIQKLRMGYSQDQLNREYFRNRQLLFSTWINLTLCDSVEPAITMGSAWNC